MVAERYASTVGTRQPAVRFARERFCVCPRTLTGAATDSRGAFTKGAGRRRARARPRTQAWGGWIAVANKNITNTPAAATTTVDHDHDQQSGASAQHRSWGDPFTKGTPKRGLL